MSNDNRPFYEPLIARHFPGWYAKREEARARARGWGAMASYRGSISTRVSSPWPNSRSYALGSSADRAGLATMRDRARRVYRDSYIGRTLLNTEVDNVIADGMVLQPKTESEPFNTEARDKWWDWLEIADVRGMLCGADLQRQFYRSPRRDGDGGVVLVDRGGESRLQYIPGDLIQQPDGKAESRNIVRGVELDPASRPVAFHILDYDEFGKRKFSRIQARNFVYITNDIEDLAVRGETCYSTIFPLLDQLDNYVDAVVIAARMAAVFGLLFKGAEAQKQHGLLPTVTNSQGNQQRAITLENGMVRYLAPEGEVAQVTPQQPMNQTPDFIRAMLRLIGMAFDMPLEMIAKDMSTVNFSSARIGLLGYYRACRVKQRRFIDRCMTRIYQWWVSREVKLGRFKSPIPANYWAHEFVVRGWDYTDPVSEVQSDLLQVTMGIKTPQMIAAERGRDFEDMQIELKAAEAWRIANELPPLPLSPMTRDAKPAPAPAPVQDVGVEGEPDQEPDAPAEDEQ